jgi:hypothetical protein
LHSASFHFQDFFFPIGFGVTRKVKLAHYGQPRHGIFDDIAAVDGNGLSGFGDATQMEETSLRGRDRQLRVNRDDRGTDRVRGLLEAKCQDCPCRKERQAHGHEYCLHELFHNSEIAWS